jgi:hypothetical protein
MRATIAISMLSIVYKFCEQAGEKSNKINWRGGIKRNKYSSTQLKLHFPLCILETE